MGYSREIKMPSNMREGLANAIQMAINAIERGASQEAVYQLVDLLEDVRSESNPYRIEAPKPRKSKSPPVPVTGNYNKEKDGDYSSWLVAMNID